MHCLGHSSYGTLPVRSTPGPRRSCHPRTKTLAARFDREQGARWWADRQWIAHVKTAQDDFFHTLLDEEFRDRATGHTDVNAEAHLFVNHYSMSTGMITSVVGFGAKFAGAYRDRDGDLLTGKRTYRIDLPADISRSSRAAMNGAGRCQPGQRLRRPGVAGGRRARLSWPAPPVP
ncbi:hypothetical protein [Kitasatospora aureofaciens]|uniref:hypothetical protein n=1 Tax=Kitasatospora aureofaciens TaxID=1894 RepID=UPI0037C59D50